MKCAFQANRGNVYEELRAVRTVRVLVRSGSVLYVRTYLSFCCNRMSECRHSQAVTRHDLHIVNHFLFASAAYYQKSIPKPEPASMKRANRPRQVEFTAEISATHFSH